MVSRFTRVLLLLSCAVCGALVYAAQLQQQTDAMAVGGVTREADLQAIGRQQEQLYRDALARLDSRLAAHPEDYEASLLKGLLLFKSGASGEAMGVLEQLTRRAPRFHLAHLVMGDLVLARTQSVTDIGHNALLAAGDEGQQSELARLRQEAEARLRAFLDSIPQGRLPRALLTLEPTTRRAIVVDKSSHRLYLFERAADGVPLLLKDYYVSTGKLPGNKSLKGDLRTPEGVYFITRHIPDEKLPDKYGIGAFPMNYPNELDRREGKTGYGIWLHGTDFSYYSRPPLDSEGCVVLPNLDLQALSATLQPGNTPIVVTERVEWLERAQWQALRQELTEALESWRRDWASGDVERYLEHYSGDFWAKGHNKVSWSQRKRRIAVGKRFQEVSLSNLALFHYPTTDSKGREIAVANFRQDYRSNNYNGVMRKRLYLAREEGGWRVLYEGRQ